MSDEKKKKRKPLSELPLPSERKEAEEEGLSEEEKKKKKRKGGFSKAIPSVPITGSN